MYTYAFVGLLHMFKYFPCVVNSFTLFCV